MTIFALLDDIASLLDDTATMTKVAAKKTASVLGDDLALNAEQASGFSAKRELIAIKKITYGAIKNKIILLPLIFSLSYVYPVAIIGLLILGGLFLAYEGAESVVEIFYKGHAKNHETDSKKIKGAIKTDFVLSIEIIVIAFSTVMDKTFIEQMTIVTIIAFAAVVFVYGIVALIVRMDDFGFYLRKKGYFKMGTIFIKSLVWIIKSLKIIGVIAMLFVSGGILSHNITYFHELVHYLNIIQHSTIFEMIIESGLAFLVGFITILITNVFKLVFLKKESL